MALINFDCPECGHNLEVDEGGAGFIVKCPECANPLQIPDLPRSHRIRKLAVAGTTLLAILLLFAANLYFAYQTRNLQAREQALVQQVSGLEQEVNDLKPLGGALQQAQALAMAQEGEIARLKTQLPEVALQAIDEAEALSRELEKTSRQFLDNHAGARTELLRAHMGKVVEAAKNSLPVAPVITDAGPGRGVQGRLIVFPLLPGPDGQTLRENAEITGIEDDKVSVKFAGGTATYSLTELHPGVAAYLPVDRLLVLPRKQWQGEVIRVHQVLSAQRDERIAQLRASIQALLPAEEE